MIFGVDYYPEHWDRSEWEKNARLMREGNFNTVRIAEFAWSRLEPEEDRFDFSWLDDAVQTLADEGISVILGTPTAAPPRWLVNKYDIYMRDKYGRPRGYGSRRESCSNNPYYIERSRIITQKLAEHYGKNPNVIAWQIDNEFGCHDSVVCYCDCCKKAFSAWLERKYKDIDELNKIYGTVFWSHEYESFDDVILPAYSSCEPTCGDARTHNPSLEMDFYRFSSDSWIKYQEMQTAIIRQYSDRPVTHNLMGHFSDIDYYKLGRSLDVVAWDNYPATQWGHSTYEETAMAHELMRGVKDKNFWVMEEQSGPCGWDKLGASPRPGQLRLWTYQAMAHGCEGILYFRFKAAPFGMEQYWYGVLDHDGIPRRRYYELQKTGAELKKLSKIFEGAATATDVLIVKSYEEVWGHKIKPHVDGFDYRDILYSYYKANNHLGTNPACGSEEMIDKRYKVIYMPAYSMVSDEVKTRLCDYVSGGGTLVLTYRSGIKDKNNNIVTATLPGAFRELAGVTVEEFDAARLDVKLSEDQGKSSVWRDILKTETAESVVRYASEYYAGAPAVTVNGYGKGYVWYIGCDLENDATDKIVKLISDKAGAEYITPPEGVEIIKRRAADTEYIMLLNHTDTERNTGISGASIISGNDFGGSLKPYDVEIILKGDTQK